MNPSYVPTEGAAPTQQHEQARVWNAWRGVATACRQMADAYDDPSNFHGPPATTGARMADVLLNNVLAAVEEMRRAELAHADTRAERRDECSRCGNGDPTVDFMSNFPFVCLACRAREAWGEPVPAESPAPA